MRRNFKTGLAALILAGGAAFAAAPASAQSFGLGIGPNGGLTFSYDSGGYCDDYGCPNDFWDLPVYYGPVFWGGYWYDGPLYYRVWYGQRQYWIRGAWRFEDWRGPRPGWWRPGRIGPALGMDYYRSHGFHGRWDNDRNNNFNRGFDNRGGNFNPRGFDNNNRPGDFNRRNDNRNDGRNDGRFNSLNQRDFGQRNVAPQQQPQLQQQQGGFDPRRGRTQQQTVTPQAAPQVQAAPAPQAAPQPAPDGNRDNRNRGERGRGRDRDGN